MQRSARIGFVWTIVTLAALWAPSSAMAEEWVAPVVGASILGAASLATAIINTTTSLRHENPSNFMRIGGYLMGSLSVAGGALLASFAHRIVDRGPVSEPGNSAPIYIAAGGLIAVGVFNLGAVAVAELFAVRRIKLAGLLDRDVSGRLYGGAAVQLVDW